MKLVVGLGNPGEKYKMTRHNVGFMVLDALMQELENEKLALSERFKGEHLLHKELILIKPHTFMNNSGDAVKSISSFYKVPISGVYVIHDDLDLKLGEYKIQKGIGPKVHGGVNSIEKKLGSKEFWRVRVGVDNRDPINRSPGDDYVLQSFNDEELLILENVIHKVVNDLDNIFS